MAINTSLLISAALLQDIFVSKQGLPLSAGIVTFYGPDQVTLKAVYFQQGLTPPYSYVAAPNPMVLSAAGTAVDVNGNDTLIFYYPFSETDEAISEPYFITVYDSNLNFQFSRSNFPYLSETATPVPPGGSNGSLTNYIVNNRFWRNAGSVTSAMLQLDATWTTQYNNTGTYYYHTLAPDQHDGFSMPDFNYVRSAISGANETITFTTFNQSSTPNLVGDVGPEYYLNFSCVADASSASLKVFQFPISLHLATLVGQAMSVTLQARSSSGATLSFYIYQFCGTGVPSPAPQLIGTKTLGVNWTKLELPGIEFRSTIGLTLGSAGAGGNDDAWYLQIGVPTQGSAICNIDFTLPSLYLTNEVNTIPVNSFATYDQIDSVVSSPRTGDIRQSLNNFYNFGWAALNNGTLVKSGSITAPTGFPISYQGNDAWALYNMLWNQFGPYSVGGASLVPIWLANGSATTTYGANAYADWNALKQLQLTGFLGSVLMGTAPTSLLPTTYSTTFTATSVATLVQIVTTANIPNIYDGMPFYITTAVGASLALNTIYYVAAHTSVTTFNVASTFANAMAGTEIAYAGGTITGNIVFLPGLSSAGEYAHTQLLTELADHMHDPLSPSTTFLGAKNSSALSVTSTGAVTNSATTGGVHGLSAQRALNVTQPSVFVNMYIKL